MTRRTSSRLNVIAVLFFLVGFSQSCAFTEDERSTPQKNSSTDIQDVGSIRVRLAEGLADEPITGRLYVFFSQKKRGQPMDGPNWFNPEPFLGVDVQGLRPGQEVVLDETSDAFPETLSRIPAGDYRVQALLDHDFYEPNPSRGVGNYYSDVARVEWSPERDNSIDLVLQNTVAPREFPESDRVREELVPSELLSQFHGRDVLQRAAVILPESYADNPDRRYPVLYIIPGFGGSHHSASRYLTADDPDEETGDDEEPTEFIRVLLNANCNWGHHVFADSATNGPRGQALIEEFIPYIDAKYRTIAAPTARFVGGHSSGGWASLWLQIKYPEIFGGVWSTAPDPVDFRDFQGVNLYADPPERMFVDEQEERRPLARRGDEPMLWFDSFGKMDDVLGRGGQLRSFEAVFSPVNKDSQPRQLWDRTTGEIDPEVANAWKDYDIRLVLENHWNELEPQLRGKLHIVTGSLDTFYLNGAVERLAETLEELGSDAEIIVVPEASHSSVLRSKPAQQMRQQMVDAFRKHHPSDT